ncbi:MAG TPA: phage terminase large subunit [Vicinamibacterales bacterium]|nr:phage terminase large subunit [Vicinamibacterales bacterium]
MIRALCVALATIGALLVGDVRLATAGEQAAVRTRPTAKQLLRSIEAQEELLARKAETSLRSFYRQQWKIVERLQPRVDNWHVDAICDHLQATVAPPNERPQINQLVINVPPRNSKSTTTCVAFPSWVWGPRNLPGKRFIFITHALRLARRDSRYTRAVITSGWYQQNWGARFRLTGDQNAKDRFDNDQTGYRMIGSMRGGVMGEGANYLVVDDPIDANKLASQNELEHIVEMWKTGLVTRLNDQINDVRIIIMQRLHENDLCGHVLKEDGWVHLKLPAAFEVEDRCRTFVYVRRDDAAGAEAGTNEPDSTGAAATPAAEEDLPTLRQVAPVGHKRVLFFEDPRTEEGEPLNPKRFPREALDKMRAEDEVVFAAQQQQRPAPRGGQILQEQWWRYYDALPVDAEGKPRKPDHGAQSWDLAFKDLKTSDFIACLVGELYGPDIYIRAYFMDRRGFGASCDEIRQMRSRYPHLPAILIEDKANGPAVIEVLRQEISGIVDVDPQGGKVARAFAAQPTLKGGNVYLPNPIDGRTGKVMPERAWVQRFVANCAVFPKGRHDDDVDAFTQLVTYLRGTHNAMLDFMKQLKARDAERARKEREGRG